MDVRVDEGLETLEEPVDGGVEGEGDTEGGIGAGGVEGGLVPSKLQFWKLKTNAMTGSRYRSRRGYVITLCSR